MSQFKLTQLLIFLSFLALSEPAHASANGPAGNLAFPNSTFIPNKVYTGKKRGERKGEKRLCQGKMSFINEWSTLFRDIKVNIPENSRPGKRRFEIDFYLGDVFFKGTSTETSAWTCEQKTYSAHLSTYELHFGVRILPTSKERGNARFELTALDLTELRVDQLKARRFGIEFGIEENSAFWNRALETHFNRFSRWVLSSGLSKLLNDLISKEVARIVENVFGSQAPVQGQRISIPPDLMDRQAQQLDKQLSLD